ncbi:MAG: ATP-binding protein [Anaerolineales bacterium]
MSYAVFIIFNICIAIYIAFLSYRKSKAMGGKSLLILSSALLINYASNLQYALSPSDLTETIRTASMLLGMTLAAISLFAFSLEYTQRSHWISHLSIILSAIIPLFTQIIFWMPDVIVLSQLRISFPAILNTSGILEKINILYRYSLITATVWLLGRTIYLRSGRCNIHFWSMLTGPLVAGITQGFLLLDLQWNWLDELSLFSISISAIGFAYNIFRPGPNVGFLVRREKVVEKMEEGWIVLDLQNSIVDLNQATAKLAGNPREKMYGKPITSVLNDFPGLTDTLNERQELEMDRTIQVNNEYHYLNIRGSRLKNDVNIPIGRLIIWRDITNRRRAEDARRQARDEMFVLLNAISNSASQTASLTEFLSDAIYQIIYPFRSQVVFICLLDDRSNHKGKKEYYVAAHLGLSDESANELNKLCSSSPLFKWLDENRQHLLLEDSQDHRIPEPMQALQISNLLAIPLIVKTDEGEKFIGALFLGRKNNSPYKQDEIVRLTLLADQIATLIDSDRRRKLSIALSERQRLMRDIHDSVSQKLYGLVTLTEATQAAIEAGIQPDYDHILSSMSENARQAVKELRLFLFQMQPIDLEKEGLVSVLHHRLAAVEGRADIKARFLADESISLSKRREVALYYIAQEALNNVLRHAHAKSVSVTLKQGYKYVTLEITDDGCGFDKTKLERGGLGLKNITERVKQENGKLTISSKPDKGTIIKVSFEKDSSNKSGN